MPNSVLIDSCFVHIRCAAATTLLLVVNILWINCVMTRVTQSLRAKDINRPVY